MKSKEQDHLVAIVFDGAKGMFLPRVNNAAKKSNWLINPYDNERYAKDDLSIKSDAVVVMLGYGTHINAFFGRSVIEAAKLCGVPTAVVSMEEREEVIRQLSSRALYVSCEDNITKDLTDWLNSLGPVV